MASGRSLVLCRVDQTAAGNTENAAERRAVALVDVQSREGVIPKAPAGGGGGGGGVVLQTSKVGGQVAVQSFRVGLRAYGVQYHFEADARMIEAYVKSHSGGGGGGGSEGGKAGLMTSAGVTAEEVRKQVDEGYDNLLPACGSAVREPRDVCVLCWEECCAVKRGVSVFGF